jgi:hypothetical protein
MQRDIATGKVTYHIVGLLMFRRRLGSVVRCERVTVTLDRGVDQTSGCEVCVVVGYVDIISLT